MITLTNELIEQGSTSALTGSWTKVQLALIGVSWPPEKGWKQYVIGREFSEETIARFTSIGKGNALAKSRQQLFGFAKSQSVEDQLKQQQNNDWENYTKL